MRRALFIFICVTFVGALPALGGDTVLNSLDGKIQLKFSSAGARMTQSILFDGAAVVEPSNLSFSIDGVDVLDGCDVISVDQQSQNDSYPTRGGHSLAINHFNGATIHLKHAKSGSEFQLEARAFDDGIAYRFIAPGRNDQSRVPDELSTFTLPAGSVVWSHNLRGHYEGTYEKKEIEQFPAGEWAAPPVTFKLPGGAGYASITEAALVNYSGMALEADGQRGFRIGLGHRQPVSYPYELRYKKEDVERLSHPAAITGSIVTPWRVVMIGKDLNALVNCDIVTNLCPPPDSKLFPQALSTSWVKPGRALWRYLDNGDEIRGDPGADPAASRPSASSAPATRPRAQVTLDEAKQWSRWAGDLGFEYNILEGFWRRFSDTELRELVDESRRRGVGIFVWVHCQSLREPQARQALLKKCHDLGIAGLKVDFFDHEHKEVIDLYHAILSEAAEYHLLLDFHGANKPTGGERTWPNELVREAIRGMEARSLTARAVHETTLPFTRFLAGHAEYTGMLFNSRRGDTTIAHQIALPVIFTAPLLTFGAHPRNILSSPAVELIKTIPSTWDQTIVLPPSEIGELALFARHSGDIWFLAAANGPNARSIKVPLSFLGEGSYRAMTVRDDDSGASVVLDRSTLTRNDALGIELRSGGGFVARFARAVSEKR